METMPKARTHEEDEPGRLAGGGDFKPLVLAPQPGEAKPTRRRGKAGLEAEKDFKPTRNKKRSKLSKSDEWRTQFDLVQAFDSRMLYTWDMAASEWNTQSRNFRTLTEEQRATNFYTKAQNSLLQDYTGKRGWTNSPYSRGQLLAFNEKGRSSAINHGYCGTYLNPSARTSDGWFQDQVLGGEGPLLGCYSMHPPKDHPTRFDPWMPTFGFVYLRLVVEVFMFRGRLIFEHVSGYKESAPTAHHIVAYFSRESPVEVLHPEARSILRARG